MKMVPDVLKEGLAVGLGKPINAVIILRRCAVRIMNIAVIKATGVALEECVIQSLTTPPGSCNEFHR